MTPAALRALLAALPWETYTHGELNEISAIGGGLRTTCRNRQSEIRSAERQQAMAMRPRQTPEQIQAAITKEQVYPTGSRLE